MADPKLRIVYIEDNKRDLEAYAGYLESAAEIVVERREPPERLKALGEIMQHRPDLVLVDIRLEGAATYGGSSLASAIRARYPDYPVVFLTNFKRRFTRRQEFAWDLVAPALDATIDKGDLAEDPGVEAQRLVSLALGYRVLRSKTRRDLRTLLAAMRAKDDERRWLTEAGPPVGHVGSEGAPATHRRHSETGKWRVVDAARWIRNVILRYPGILYDAVHSATLLGITTQSFQRQEVQKLLGKARYEGVFAPQEGRWWRNRMQEIATRVMQGQEIAKPILHGFREAFGRQSAVKLEPSVCNSCDKTPADTVCSVLHEPVMTQCSLAYNPDGRPVVMDEARVSFKAVRESNDFRPELLSPEGREIAEAVMSAS